MAVEGIRPQIERETLTRPALDHPEIVEVLRHGNIYEVLRSAGVNRRDIEDYLASQWHLFQNQILQDYEVYAAEGTIPAPALSENFSVHAKEMSLDTGDHGTFQHEMQFLQNYQPEVQEGAKPKVQFKAMTAKADAMPEGQGQDVKTIAEKALNEWSDFFSELQMHVIDAQMVREMQSKTKELNREVQRIISMVMSGQVDPEYVLIAAAKSNMLQNGTLFSWKGRRIFQLNEEMNRASKDMLKTNANDQGYLKELQAMQSKTRSASTQMQLELMDIQKFAQNVATTLDWVSNAIRMFAQMRQTPTQAIAAR